MTFDPTTARPELPFDPTTARPEGQPSPRDVLGVAVKVNPEHAAEAARLAKRYPAPNDMLLRNLQDVKMQAAVDAADERLRTDVPTLQRKMSELPFAQVSHDDVDVLGSIEGFFRQTGRSAKSGVFGASRGAAGVFQAGAELAAPLLDVLEPDNDAELTGWRGSIGGNPLRRLAEGFAAIGQQNLDTQKSLRPQQPGGNIESGFFSGIESLTQNLLMLPLAFAPGGHGAALGGMSGLTGGQSYQDARQKGLGMSQALPYAASQAAIEYATEKMPLGKLLGDVRAGTPIMQTLMRQVVAEVPSEQVATILQDLNEWAVLNPDKPFTSYLEERPSAAAQTLVATLVGASGNVAVAKGIESVVNAAVRQDAQIAKGDADTLRLADAMAAAGQSKLRERAPETFAEFVQQAAEGSDGAPTAVYVDPRALTDALNQAGISDDQLAQLLPSVPAQIADAFEAGTPVEIPIGEALAAAPGTPLEQVLLQNARTEPDGLSRLEVDEAAKQAETLVKQEAERIMQEAQTRAENDQQVEQIKTTITEQLNAAGRFRPEANQTYATLVGAFYSTMAQRTGMTPSELYARYPLRVTGEMQTGQALEQGDERDLIVTHNLSASNLLHAKKMGGIAVPSLAVTKKDTPLTGFGEITLIGDKNLADPKGYAGTRVFGADIYSPRYPNVERELDKKAAGALQKALQPMADKLGLGTEFDSQDLERKGQESLERSLAALGTFLQAQGIEPKIIMRTGMDEGRRVRLEQFGLGPFMDKTSTFDMTGDDAFRAAALAEARDAYAAAGKRDALVKSLDTDERFQDNVVRSTAQAIANDAKLRARPEADKYATQQAMEQQVADANLAGEFQQWVQRELAKVTKSERIFQGFTNSGNRKYIPHTLENVVKLLKKELRGGESFNYGVGSLRAKFTPEFKSLAAIKKAKDKLVSAEQFEAVKKEVDAEFDAVASAIDPSVSRDTATAILEDAATAGVKPAAKSYGYDISDEAAQKVAEFLTRLRNLPTAYFEAKVLRDVSPAEFKGAVVPDDISPEALAYLRENVSDVRTYAKGNEADRAAKIGEFSDLFFQKTRATFSPSQMLIALGPNADYSSFLHESGHAFLEILADIASQPGAPQQIVDDWQTTLNWFGVTTEQWAGMTLDQKRPYHERWAESVEQYFFEGKAPSVELRGVFDRFRTWLTAVYKSLKQFLAMRATTPGGAAAVGELNQAAFHGTPHRGIEKFSTDAIGTGEGAQVYGWGLYFASKREIAEWYRGGLSYREMVNKFREAMPDDAELDEVQEWAESGEPPAEMAAVIRALAKDDWLGFDYPAQALTALFKDPDAYDASPELKAAAAAMQGQLYKVDIPEDSEMLLWDRPLSEQPDVVRNALKGGEIPNVSGQNILDMDPTGEELYRAASRMQNGDSAASQWLAEFGIKGIKYLDGTSRSAGEGSYNYVVFSGDDVTITDQFYQSNQPAAGPLGLSDEVRAVMDRLLATDEQIAEAERVRQYGLLFKSPEEAGMTPEQWAAYTSADEKAHAEALTELSKRSLRDMGIVMRKRMRALRDVQADMAEKRKVVREEAAAQIAAEPVYRAMRWLKKGEMTTPDGEDIKAADGFKLDAAVVAELFPESMLGRPDMTKLRGMTAKKGGLHPDIVAEMFGYADGAALITAITQAFPQADQVEGLTDQLMLERYGDLSTPRGMERAADEAVHNENRARVLAAEMAAVERANNARTQPTGGRTANAMVAAAKQFAERVVAGKRIKDLKPQLYSAAETRAAKAAEKALAKGDTQAVIVAKRDQLLNFQTARAANAARTEVLKIEARFKKIATAKDDTVSKTRDLDVVKATQAILAAYGVGTRGEQATAYLDKVKTYDPEMYAAIEPSITAALLNAKPLDELTVDELRALDEEVQALWYLAKRSRQMEVDGNLLDRQEVEDALKARMLEIGIPDSMPGDTRAITPAEQRALKLKYYLAAARRAESWTQAMDGSERMGSFRRFVWNPVKDAADAYRKDKADYLKRFRDLLDPIQSTLTKRKIAAPELNYTFGEDTGGVGMSEVLHALLHTGNDSNKRKLLLGRKWATENPEGTLDTTQWDAFVQRLVADGTLRKEHFDFAQGVWDLLEEMKPLAQKTHRDVFGKYFAEVTADSFMDPFGVQRRGGYVPAIADARIVSDKATKALMEAENESLQFAFPSTSRGFTKSRVDSYTRPLMLDLRTLTQHIDKVLKFSHLEQPVRDVRKVLTAKGVAYGLNRIDPVAFDGVLTPWLNRAAKQIVETPIPGDGGLLRFFSAVRNRAGMAAMFANFANAAQQLTGFSIAAVRVPPKYLVQSAAAYMAAPRATAQAVADKSIYMASRMENEVSQMTGAINDILLDPNVYEKAQAWTQKHAYFLQSAVDNVMSPIIWTGAYNQALEQGATEKDAVRQADAVIRETQGSTLPEDVSRIETGNPFVRVFTQFMGYFNMQANLLGTEMVTISRELGLRKGAGRAFYAMLLGFLAPAWVAEAIMQAFRGGPDDEDKDGEFLDDWLAAVFGLSTLRGATAMLPGVGPVLSTAFNTFNDKPYDDRISTSPAISMIESGVKLPSEVYKAIADDSREVNAQKMVRDTATVASLLTGIPFTAIARPAGYLAAVEQGKVSPTSPADAARGVVTGVASPESKTK